MTRDQAAAAALTALKEVLEWVVDDRDLRLDTKAKQDDWRDVLAAREQMLKNIIAKAEAEDEPVDDGYDNPMPRPKFTGRTRR